MVSGKRAAADPTSSSNENIRTCNVEGGTTEPLISDEFCLDYEYLRSQLGEQVSTDMSKSVVTLVLSRGHEVVFACSGVAIERRWLFTRFVTTASLDTFLRTWDDVKIEVCCQGKLVIGVLEGIDSKLEIAFVRSMTALDVHSVRLYPVVEWKPETEVVAVSRDVSGNLMAKTGKLQLSGDYIFSTALPLLPYECNQGWLGSASFDIEGNFVGLNLFPNILSRSDLFPIILSRSEILARWKHMRTPERESCLYVLGENPQEYEDVPSNAESEDVLPSTSKDTFNRGIALLNAHHDPFGDLYPNEGVWGEFDKSFSLLLSKSVVALASFTGGIQFFSCTGFFINFDDDDCQTILTSATLVRHPDGSHKIVEGLKIKVLLPNNRSIEGKLKHCSLQYNVALVSVENGRYVRHVRHLDLEKVSLNFSSTVVAVGRSFESGALMATSGRGTCWSGPFDCEDLCYSTCKISKVGVGGPLVGINGNFVGMNYYDKKMGTPFLFFDVLCGILQYFKTKKTEYRSMAGQVCHIREGNEYEKNQWVLPDPGSMYEPERNEERKALASLCRTRSRRIQYAYTDGDITVLK